MRIVKVFLRQPQLKMSILLAGSVSLGVDVVAQTKSGSTNPTLARVVPIKVTSPIEYFRELLSMKPIERERELATKTPGQRSILTAKIHEYEGMTPNERELRLRMTQLRWYLLPLMKQTPLERGKLLASIPAADRETVERRLKLWDEIPVHLQKEFLENETNISYFMKWEASTPEQRAKMFETFPSDRRAQWETELNKWKQLDSNRRQEMCDRFNQFFELDEKEKDKTLSKLSDAERQQMEKTLSYFKNLSPEQRRKCVESFKQFSNMTAQERSEFLRNAERWQAMTPNERQAWRELVQHHPPLPPLPQLIPPRPPHVLTGTNSLKGISTTAGH